MNRKRVIFVKDIKNNEAKQLSSLYKNVIFFTNDINNQQIWFNGQKCSGITRIHNTQNISIFNYKYSSVKHYSDIHSVYYDNFRIVLTYDSKIENMVQTNKINATLLGDNIENHTVEWSIDDDTIFKLPDNISTKEIDITYNINDLLPYKTTLHALVDSKYDVYIELFVSVGEIVPFDNTIEFTKFNVEKTKISVDESISLKPVLTYSTLGYTNILPSIEIEKMIWTVSDETVCKISNDGMLTAIYNPKLDSNTHKTNIKVKCEIQIKNHAEILSNTIDITIYNKYYNNSISNFNTIYDGTINPSEQSDHLHSSLHIISEELP